MAEPESQPAGELIVQNGKRKGTRLPLRPVTSIGSASGCDVKLSGEGVMPVHCVIGLTPAGPALRAGFASGITLVNGSPSEEGLLTDGDELKVGPCIFQVAWSAAIPILPPLDTLPLETTQIAEILDDRQRQIAEYEAQLTAARAAFRVERESRLDQLDSSREELERLKREAFETHREAMAGRDKLKKVAARFIAQLRRKWLDTRQEVAFDQTNVNDARGRFDAEIAEFSTIRSAFYTEAAEARERLRHDWAALESYRQRATADRVEADEYYAKQDSAIEMRSSELATREHAIAEARTKLDSDTAALRTESSGLEARIVNARAIVEELERKRDELQALALTPTATGQPPMQFSLDRHKDRDLTAWAAELDAREQKLNDDRAALVALKASFDTESTNIADRRRVLAEQFGLLTAARNAWQEAEGRTVDEMEELARDLRYREQQLDMREDRLMKADGRRREDAYELWQFRLRLEGWQTKLTAVERRWHSERELREAEYAQRVQQLTLREASMDAAFTKWEETHEQDRERLRIELRQWTEDRTALMRSAAEFDRQRQDMLAELVTLGSRAMAAEQSVAGAIQDAGSTRAKRRLDVLRKRWERSFTRIRDDATKRTTAATEDLVQIDGRYRELLRLLNDVVGREATLNVKIARAEFAALAGLVGEVAKTIPSLTLAPISSEELVALRDEVERMAGVLLTAEMPDPLSLAEEITDPDVLPFGGAKAA